MTWYGIGDKPLYEPLMTYDTFMWHQPQELTHWGRDKRAAISQMTLSNTFSWMKMLEFRFEFHWSLFLRVKLTIFQHWFRYWLGADQATSHYLNQLWKVYWCIYASLGLNELNETAATTTLEIGTCRWSRWNLWEPHLQMNCRDVSTWKDTTIVASALVAGWHVLLNKIVSRIRMMLWKSPSLHALLTQSPVSLKPQHAVHT